MSLTDGTRTIVIRDEPETADGFGGSCWRNGSGATIDPRREDRRRAGEICGEAIGVSATDHDQHSRQRSVVSIGVQSSGEEVIG